MTALYVIGAIVACVLLIASLPLTIVVTCHTKKGIHAKAGFPPFFYLTLYPTYEDIFSKEGFLKDDATDEDMAAYMAKIMNTYLPKEATQKKKSKSTKELLSLTKLAGKIFFSTVERWSIVIKRCHISVGTSDAAETAYLYGGVSALVSYLLALIDKFTKTEPNTKKIRIDADFESGETTLDIRIDARVNLTKIVLQYIKVLLKQQKHKLPSQSAQKG